MKLKFLLQPLALVIIALFNSNCSHTVDFRSSHFAVPHVNEKQWAGNVSMSVAKPTEVTLISDSESNPPGRNVSVNEDVSLESIFEIMFTIDMYGVEFDLTVAPQLEFYTSGNVYGLRWQFLGYGSGANSYVASLQGGVGNFASSSGSRENSPKDYARSDIRTTQMGLSVGYKWDKVLVYGSYVQDQHEATTSVENDNGDFGPYTDSGEHGIVSLGVSSHSSSTLFGVEINGVNAKWNDSVSDTSESIGVRIGYQW